MIKRLHHVAVLSSDIQLAVTRYRKMLSASEPRVTHVERPDLRLWTAMVAAGAGSGSYVQLIQPELGPGVAELERQGDGTIYEIAFEVDDIEAAAAAFRAMGHVLCDLLGRSIDGPYLVAMSGSRYFYLDPSRTGGTHVEVIQVMVGVS